MQTTIRALFAVALVAVGAPPLLAHGPTPQKADEKIEIAAPPDAVWVAIKTFADLGWHPGIAKVEAEGGNAPGAMRTITLASGGVLVEGLDEYNDAEKFYGYRLSTENIDAFPVSFYSATLSVKPAGRGSEVEWTSRFYRADTGNEPPKHLSDEAAVKAMTTFMQQGLQGLKAKLEGKG